MPRIISSERVLLPPKAQGKQFPTASLSAGWAWASSRKPRTSSSLAATQRLRQAVSVK
jgi:hypothetical protein